MTTRAKAGLLVLVLASFATPASAAPAEGAPQSCDEALERGIDARESCERALRDQPESPRARASLALALLDRTSPIRREDRARASELIEQALADAPHDFEVQRRGCQVALLLDDHALAARTSEMMLALDERDPRGHILASHAALDVVDSELAYRHYRVARSLGSPSTALAELEARIDREVPWYIRVSVVGLPLLGVFALGWAAALLVLVGSAVLLHWATEQRIRALTAAAGEEHSRGARVLRRVHRLVFGLCCLLYFASIPMVVLLILAFIGLIALGQLVLADFEVRDAATSNVILFAIVLGSVAVAAVVRGMFVRGRDIDLGREIEIAKHPRLRALLDRVSQRTSSRRIDTLFVIPDFGLRVTERGTFLDRLRGKPERCLILGIEMLPALEIRELSVMMAREQCLFDLARGWSGPLLEATRRSIHAMAARFELARGWKEPLLEATVRLAKLSVGRSADEGGHDALGLAVRLSPLWLFVIGFRRLFVMMEGSAGREQELLADRWVARIYDESACEPGDRDQACSLFEGEEPLELQPEIR